MTGVEILATHEVVVAYAWNWYAYLFTIGVSVILVLIMSFFALDRDLPSAVFGLVAGLLIGAILGILPVVNTLPYEYETRYKVTISDEVSMNDFLERYEILDQEDKIYTVRERDGVEE